MPNFRFRAKDATGRTQAGATDAPSAAALADDLRGRGWLILEIAQQAGQNRTPRTFYIRSVRSIDVEVSLQQIASMLRGGVTLLAALQTVIRQAPRRAMAAAWQGVSEDVQEGSSLADAMADRRCFSQLVVQLVRIGEQTGTLEQVLDRAARTLESRRILKANALTALTYPMLVLAAAMGVTSFMILYLIPQLETFLESLGRTLPPTTQFLLDVSHVVNTYWIQALILIVTLIVGFIAFYRWPQGRAMVDHALLRIPVIGRILRLSGTAGFSKAMGVLISSGITILESLRTAEGLMMNHRLSSTVALARQAVLNGGSLAEPLSRPGAFMPMLGGMVEVGETAGSLEDSFDEVASFHEHQLQSAIKRLSVIIEPAIVVVVGGIVGFVYVSFFQALYAGAAG